MTLIDKTNTMWKTVELLAYSYYASKGYAVLISITDNAAYDLVIEKNGVFAKVNVKVAGLKYKKDSNSWSISIASGPTAATKKAKDAVASKGLVDRFLVWMPEEKGFVQLPGDFFLGSGSKSKRIPKSIFPSIEKIEI